MIKHPKCERGFILAGAFALTVVAAPSIRASAVIDTFGSGANQFMIDFVDVPDINNLNDAGPNGGPYGGVKYGYQMGKYEISQEMIIKAAANGLTGVTTRPPAWGDVQPSADINWFEAAAFVNWLNTSKGHHKAYNLTGPTTMVAWSPADAWDNDPGVGSELNLFRHKSAVYVLPSEDEWYKTAFYDPLTGGYVDYATNSNLTPTAVAGGTGANTAVFNFTAAGGVPAAVTNAGGVSAYGTMAQSGNVFEWSESAYDGENDFAGENRTILGGGYNYTENYMRSKYRGNTPQIHRARHIGFRVAKVPEPSSALLFLGTGLALSMRRRR